MNLIDIKKQKEEGLTYQVISALYGVSRQRVERIARERDKYRNLSYMTKKYQSHYRSHIVKKWKPRDFCKWCEKTNES